MTLYVCLDDRNGMLFNKRRQSRDAAVLDDIRRGLPASLTISPFSEKLIRDSGIAYTLTDADPAALSADTHFFTEAPLSADAAACWDTIVIYRWNRHYPADTYWETDLLQAGFLLRQTEEFPGKSHEIITKEVYTK